jgi:hypothetical protein
MLCWHTAGVNRHVDPLDREGCTNPGSCRGLVTQALGVMQQEVLTGSKTTAASVKAASDRIDAILRD